MKNISSKRSWRSSKKRIFNEEVKHLYAEKMNERMSEVGYKMTVFDKDGPYLPAKKIGKNNPKEKFIRQNNAARLKWNTSVSKALYWKIPVAVIIAVKKSEVIRPMREAFTASHDKGTAMDMMTKIIVRAALTMSNFLNKLIRHQLLEKIKPNDELFSRVLSDSRKVKDKSKNLER